MLTPTSDALTKAIKAEEHPELMKLLGNEFHRVEALMNQCPPNHPMRPQLTRAMTVFVGQLNRMIAKACLVLGYPLKQWEWKDSAPLSAVADAYPLLGLEGTDWYQRHLGMVMMAPSHRHPWWDLPTHATAISTSEQPSLAECEECGDSPENNQPQQPATHAAESAATDLRSREPKGVKPVDVNPLADPKLWKLTANVTAKAVKAGVYTFAEFVANMKASFGDRRTRKLAPVIERAWTRLREIDTSGKMDEAGDVNAILDEGGRGDRRDSERKTGLPGRSEA